MDFTPCQPSSRSFFKPYPAASQTAGMGWASGSLVLWTGQPEEHYPHQNAPHEAGSRQVRFSTTGQISMVSTSMRTKSCCPVLPLIPQLTGGTSSSNPPPLNHLQRSPYFLLCIYFFGGSTIRTVPTEMSFHPAPMIQKWLWIEYLKLTQFILNRMVKSKQSCNETFLIFKEQISGMSG